MSENMKRKIGGIIIIIIGIISIPILQDATIAIIGTIGGAILIFTKN